MRKILPITLLVVFLFVLALPYLLSVPPFKSLLIASLEAKTNTKIDIDKIRFSWLGPQKIDGIHLSNQQLDGHFEQVVLKTPFWKIASQPYSLLVTNGNFQVVSSDASKGSIEQIHIVVDGANVHATGITSADGQKGSFIVQGTAASAQKFDLAFSADALPTDPIDCLLGSKGDLKALLGSSFAVNGSIANQFEHGSVVVNLNAVNAKASIQATFNPTSITLDAPMTASGPVPPSIRKELAKKGIAFKDPIAIQVSDTSFFLPRPFALDKLRISSASVNLGRIAVPKPAKFDALSKFLKAPQLDNPHELDIWLTPVDFALNGGQLNLQRIDFLLAQSIHLCCWGNLNLLEQQLNMVLGVPADTLAQTGLLSSATSDYVLQVPVSGSFENPKFDTKTATVQMAGAFASDQVQKVGGNLGPLGDLIGKAANKITQPEDTPPQRYRLPWQR